MKSSNNPTEANIGHVFRRMDAMLRAVDDQFPYKKVGLFLPVISRGIPSRHTGEIIPLTHLQSQL